MDVLLICTKAALEEKPRAFESFAKFANLRVLLVEDNLINQEVMLAILKGLEINVDVANDRLEALTMFAHSR
jgi:PleD family two-component response regulator